MNTTDSAINPFNVGELSCNCKQGYKFSPYTDNCIDDYTNTLMTRTTTYNSENLITIIDKCIRI
jgi:hypothetical protein